MDAFDAFNAVQVHVLHAASAHVDRIVLEAFVAGIASCESASVEGQEARKLLNMVCDLYALATIEEHRAWYLEHQLIDGTRSKAIRSAVEQLSRELSGRLPELIEGLGVPEGWLNSAMLTGAP